MFQKGVTQNLLSLGPDPLLMTSFITVHANAK